METSQLVNSTVQNISFDNSSWNFNFNTIQGHSTASGQFHNNDDQGETQMINFKNYQDQPNQHSMMINDYVNDGVET